MNPETLTREKEGPQLHQPLSGTLVCTARARADWGAAAQFTNVPLFGCCIADFCSPSPTPQGCSRALSSYNNGIRS